MDSIGGQVSWLTGILDGLKKVGGAIDHVTDVIDPYADLIKRIPVVGDDFIFFYNLLKNAEILGSKYSSGAERKTAVATFFTLKFPTIDKAKLSGIIDAQIAVLNNLSEALKEAASKPKA